MTTTQEIERCLQEAFRPAQLSVRDDSARHAGHAGAIESGGGHFHVRIVANAFKGMPRLERHRRIYAALDRLLPHAIHALAIDATAPEDTAAAE